MPSLSLSVYFYCVIDCWYCHATCCRSLACDCCDGRQGYSRRSATDSHADFAYSSSPSF